MVLSSADIFFQNQFFVVVFSIFFSVISVECVKQFGSRSCQSGLIWV